MNTQTLIIIGIVGYIAYQQYHKNNTTTINEKVVQGATAQKTNASTYDLQMPGPSMSFLNSTY